MTYLMHEFIQDLVSGKIPPDEQIYNYFSKTDTKRLGGLISRLQRARSIDVRALSLRRKASNAAADGRLYVKGRVKIKEIEGAKSRAVGRIFEDIVKLLCHGCSVFSTITNIRTSTSEIDVLIGLGPTANIVPMLKNAGSHLLGEAKCHTSGLRQEWVNELVGMMSQHNCNHSVLFVASPSKTLTVDHRVGLQLHAKDGKMIVPFGLKQLSEVAKGSNFLSVLSRQYVHVQTGATALAI